MSFQFPESTIQPSTSPSGNSYPAVLVMRETAEIPTGISAEEAERARRRITRNVLDAFWQDIEACSAAPFLQILNRGTYNASAQANREAVAAMCGLPYPCEVERQSRRKRAA